MDLEPGTWIDDRYKILRLLGKGQEGSVYLAFQETLFRFYAVKELKKEGVCFSRESVEVWKTLHCPGLPEVADILETEDTVLIVSEYIEGINLQEYLKKGGKVTLKMAVRWCLQIGEVLEYLHHQNPPIAYGDLKPDNLMLQRDQMVLVDMGSLIRQGSGGKYTGTKEYTKEDTELQKIKPEKRDGYSYGRLMELLAETCGNKKLKKLAMRLMGKEKKTISISKARRELKKLGVQNRFYAVMLFLTGCLLAGMGVNEVRALQWNTKELEYSRELDTIRLLRGEEQQQALEELVLNYPERKEGYLKLLESFQEDLVMEEQEDLYYRKLWKQIPEKRESSCRELLKQNPADWQEVAYESGITYWYFYKGLEGKRYAARWFAEITQMPETIVSDPEIRKKSQLYEKMGEYRDKWKKYDETGEGQQLFADYWKDCEELLTFETGQMTQTRLLLWSEMLATWKHYMVELKACGITKEQLEEKLWQIIEEQKQIPDSNSRMQELGERLAQDVSEIRQMIARIYQI